MLIDGQQTQQYTYGSESATFQGFGALSFTQDFQGLTFGRQ
jgi:hypothetical protein